MGITGLDTTGELSWSWLRMNTPLAVRIPKLIVLDSFFQSPDGSEIWNVYHATRIQTGACDGNRYTAVKKVNWNSDGSPNFGRPETLGTVFAGPSGE